MKWTRARIKKEIQQIPSISPKRDYFQALVRSIIFQQLSGTAANAILKKFLALFPGKTFPKPEHVLKISDTAFRSAGVSTQKIGYIRDLATKFLDGTINTRILSKQSDQEIIEHLVQIKGVGVWTAHMFLIFTLGRPNVLPTGDLAVKYGVQKVFELEKVPTEKEMQKLALPFEGEYSRFARLLWKIMDEEKALRKVKH